MVKVIFILYYAVTSGVNSHCSIFSFAVLNGNLEKFSKFFQENHCQLSPPHLDVDVSMGGDAGVDNVRGGSKFTFQLILYIISILECFFNMILTGMT